MGKKRMAGFTVGIIVLLLVAVFLLAHGRIHRTGNIVLPEIQAEDTGLKDDESTESLNVIQITPGTVQPAITTLSRPASYSRTQVVETFWSGGSGRETYEVAVSGGLTRIDLTTPDGGSRHVLLTGQRGALWYDEDRSWTEFEAGQTDHDAMQRMPTYEVVRDLPVSQIQKAEYRTTQGGESCIYVETVPNEAGYGDRYWVSTASGLLIRAERIQNDKLIYRFTAGPLREDPPEEGLFRLPDGSLLESGE